MVALHLLRRAATSQPLGALHAVRARPLCRSVLSSVLRDEAWHEMLHSCALRLAPILTWRVITC
jgi:hypothetical protein